MLKFLFSSFHLFFTPDCVEAATRVWFLLCLYSPATRFCSLEKNNNKKTTGLCWTLVGTKTEANSGPAEYRCHLWHHIGRRVPQLCVRHSFSLLSAGFSGIYFWQSQFFIILEGGEKHDPSLPRVSSRLQMTKGGRTEVFIHLPISHSLLINLLIR